VASRPTIENARWGETAAGVVGPNDTAPSSGQKDTGYATNAIAVSSFYNRTLRELYLWAKYLNDPDGGELLHGLRTVCLPGATFGLGATIIGDVANQQGNLTMDATTEVAYYPIVIPTGSRLVAVRARIQDNATGTTRVRIQGYRRSNASSGIALSMNDAALAQSAGTGAIQTIEANASTPGSEFPRVVAAGEAVYIVLTISANNLCTIQRVEYDYDRV
jgi:hypothetical protein